MRLINIHTHLLHTFLDTSDIPPYITLSHRWTSSETSFEEYTSSNTTTDPTQTPNATTPGLTKVHAFCTFLRNYNRHKQNQGQNDRVVEYIWIDTACIDKRSSAELSEAINSMAGWYRDARYCVAYLSDVPADAEVAVQREAFVRSAWFTRGWCLQELLFPEEILFVDAGWKIIGKKSEGGFAEMLSARTGIPRDCLRDRGYMMRQCVARKMSWASGRFTTRVEDVAYCLLGLFNIQMGLLYGEGTNAFARLQEEIIRQTDDESIFAWSLPRAMEGEWGKWHAPRNGFILRCPSVLAPSPRYFEAARDAHLVGLVKRKPYTITNKGLEFESRQTIKVKNEKGLGYRELFVIELNCGSGSSGGGSGSDRSSLMAIDHYRDGRYGRVVADPRKVPNRDWTGDEFLWQYLSGYDAKNTKLDLVEDYVFHIKVNGSAKSYGGLNFNDTPFMEKFVTVRSILNGRRRDMEDPRNHLGFDERKLDRRAVRQRAASHSPPAPGARDGDEARYAYPRHAFMG